MERKIIWLKWTDPMAPMVYAPEENYEQMMSRAAQDSFLGDEDTKYEGVGKNGNIGPCVMGPHGIIPIHESILPGKLFNFWVMHTNFDLGSIASNNLTFAQLIGTVEGVETLDVFTRYRARIAVGKTFSQDAVKTAIEKACFQTVPVSQPAKADDLTQIKRSLSDNYKLWIIYQMPDGKYEYFGGQTSDEINEKQKISSLDKARVIARSW